MNAHELSGWGIIVLFILLIAGWVLNIIKLISIGSLTGFAIARGIGIFVAPLGAVLGFF